MREEDLLAEQFESNRAQLRAVAYRMLGSLTEADDAVQEAWIRLSRSDTSEVQNLAAWLTTVVGRVCLDMLRTRTSRREDAFEAPGSDQRAAAAATAAAASGSPTVGDPEQEAVMADSVGLALLVVLETLPPAERLAFVLHDVFAVPFDEIAPIVDRSPTATRQLASRARRRVQGRPALPEPDLARQRQVVDAYLAAAQGGDFDALLAVLDPDVVLRADALAVPAGAPTELRGAELVARQALVHRAGGGPGRAGERRARHRRRPSRPPPPGAGAHDRGRHHHRARRHRRTRAARGSSSWPCST